MCLEDNVHDTLIEVKPALAQSFDKVAELGKVHVKVHVNYLASSSGSSTSPQPLTDIHSLTVHKSSMVPHISILQPSLRR